MDADTIIAIDLGRHNSVACVYSRATRAHAFRTLGTTPADLDRLLARHPGAPVVSRRAPTPAGCTTGRSPPGTR